MVVSDFIGIPALMEQCAEECTELAKSCLKMARKMRNENPTPMGMDKILNDLTEEFADVSLCMDQIMEAGLLSEVTIDLIKERKIKRWEKRLEEMPPRDI